MVTKRKKMLTERVIILCLRSLCGDNNSVRNPLGRGQMTQKVDLWLVRLAL